jgi:hypothetical protein
MASQFSEFAPSGIRFSARKPHSEKYYETLKAQWGSLFADDPTADINVEIFALAKCLGLAREQLERAGNQTNPKRCVELLPKLERDYKISPAPNATIRERQDALTAAKAVKGGALIGPLRDGLRAILGDKLLAVVPQSIGDIGTGGMFPDTNTPHITGPGTFKSLGDRFKIVTIDRTVPIGSIPVWYTYKPGAEPLIAGEKLTINPDGWGNCETVTVTKGSESYESLPRYGEDEHGAESIVLYDAIFLATFTRSHSLGEKATTATMPIWTSIRRLVNIVVEQSAFSDAKLISRVNRYMRKSIGKAVQWNIIASSGAGTSGPFMIGSSIMGQTPISTVNY